VPKGQFDRLTPEQSRERSETVRALAFEQGKSIAEIAAIVGSISESRIGQILDTGNDRKRVLYYLEHHGGGVDNIRDIAVGLDMDINKAQFLVDNLRKKGQVTADIGKASAATGDHRAFTNIRLKKRQHGKIRTERLVAPTLQVAPDAPAFVQERIPEQLTNGHHHGPENPFDTPEVAAALEAHTRAEIEASAPDLPEELVETAREILAIPDIPRYPLLARLLDRDAKIAEAARLLESAGLDDLAIAALQRQDEFTDLEREYMRFARAQSLPGVLE
jgi:hypothetical protein